MLKTGCLKAVNVLLRSKQNEVNLMDLIEVLIVTDWY